MTAASRVARRTNFRMSALFVWVSWGMLTGQAGAITTSLIQSGYWDAVGMWSEGMPTPSDLAIVDGGFSVVIGGTQSIGLIRVGDSGTGNVILQNAGNLTSGAGSLGDAAGSNGTVTLNNGYWHATSIEVGRAGTGTLSFTGGIATVDSGNGPLILAVEAGSTGTLKFDGNGLVAVSRVDTGLGTAKVMFVNYEDDYSEFVTPLCGTLSVDISGGYHRSVGANTYSGGTTIRDSGILIVDNDGQLGAVPASPSTNITLDNGLLMSGATFATVTLDAKRNIALSASGGNLQSSDDPLIVNGVISGSGGLGVVWASGLVVLNGANNYTGATTIGTTITTTCDRYRFDSRATPTLRLGNAHALPGTDLIFGTDLNNTATLDLNGHDASVAALTGGAKAVVDVMGSGQSSTLSVGNGNADGSFQGGLKNTGGTLALTKIGAGTQALSGASTYTDGTTILAGRLAVGHSTGLGTGPVTLTGRGVDSPATLESTLSNSTLNVGVLTLDGVASIVLPPNGGIQSAGAVVIHSTGNSIEIAGDSWGAGTHTLLAGTSLELDDLATITLTGSVLDGRTLAVGTSVIVGDTIYTYGSNATSLYLQITPFNSFNSLIASGDWNTPGNWSAGVPDNSSLSFTCVDGGHTVAVAAGVVLPTDTVWVGYSGTGTLSVNSGAILISSAVSLGYAAGSNGTANIIEGTWETNTLEVGQAGTGILNLMGGGVRVANGNGPLMLAVQPGSIGTLNIDTYGAFGVSRVDTGLGTAKVAFLNYAGSAFDTPLCGTLSVEIIGGSVSLSRSNTHKGGTTVRGSGTLILDSDYPLGAVPASPSTNITLDNGLLISSPDTAVTLHAKRGIFLGAGGGDLRPAYDQVFTVNGAISGVGGLRMDWIHGVLVLNGSNSYSGATTIGSTVLGDSNESALPTLRLGNDHAMPGTDVIFGTNLNHTAILDLNGHNATIAALSGGAHAVVDVIDIGGTSTLTVGNGGADGIFEGLLQNTGGTLALTKIGAGRQTLSGTNTYTGGTTILAGHLEVASHSTLGTGAVTLTGSGADTPASLAYPSTYHTLEVAALTLNGFASIELSSQGAVLSSGTVAIHGTGNSIVITGDDWIQGQNTLLSGPSLELEDPESITLTGAALGGQTLAVGDSIVIGNLVYSFGANARALYLTIGPPDRLLWTGAAANHQWDTTSNNWQALSNWGVSIDSNLAFSNGMAVTFGNTEGNIIVTDEGVTAADIQVDNASGSMAFGGGAIVAGAFTKSGAGNISLSNGISLDGFFANTGSGSALLTGSLSQGGVYQNGDGTLTLAASNAYTGSTTVNVGTLMLADANAVYNSTVTLSGGSLRFDSAVSGHAFTLGGLTGAVGNLALQDNAVTPNPVALSVGNNHSNTLYAGVLSGSGSLTKMGTGTLTLTGQSTYQGATVVMNGELKITGGAGISQTSSVMVDSGSMATTAALTVDGLLPSSIVSLGNMTVGDTGNGVLTLRNWATVDLGGRDGNGTLMLGASGGSGTLLIGTGAAAGTLHAAQVTGGTGTNSIVFNHNENRYLFTPILTGNVDLLQQGSGTTVLTGNNTHIGTTTLEAGTLTLGSADALGTSGQIFFSGGTLRYGDGNAADYSNRLGNTENQSYQIDTNGQNVTWASPLTSVGGTLNKTGAGALILTGVNTYSAGTVINGGTLGFATDSLGNGWAVAITGNACLQWQTGNTQDLSGRLQIGDGIVATIDTLSNDVTFGSPLQTGGDRTGALAKSGIGTLTLTEVNTYTGGTILNAGTLAFANEALGTGTVAFAGNANLQWLTGNTQDLSDRLKIEDGVIATLDTHGNDVSFASALQTGSNQTGALAKTGAGTLTLTGENTYTGGTTLTAGTLAFTNGALGSSGTVAFVGNASLQWVEGNTQDLSGRLKIDDGVTATLDTLGNCVTFSSALQTGSNRTGALTKTGEGALLLGTANDHTGATTVSAGMLQLLHSAALHNSTLVMAGGGLVFDNSVTDRAFTLGGLAGEAGNSLQLQDNAVEPNAIALSVGNNHANTLYAGDLSGSGSLAKIGTGTLTLTASNSYSGGTTLHAGTLAFANGALGTGTVSIAGNAFLQWQTGNTQDLSSQLKIEDGIVATLDIQGNDVTFGSALQTGINRTSALIKSGAGTLALTSTNAYTGGTTLNAGTLAFSSGALGTGAVDIVGNARLQWLDGNTQDLSHRLKIEDGITATLDISGQSVTLSSALQTGLNRTGALAKTGVGTLVLTGANTYTGGTTLNAGTLAFVDGSLSTGTVTIGGNACLQWLNGNTQDLSSRLKIDDGITATLDINDNDVIFTSTIQTGSNRTGALAKTGAGTLYLADPNTYSGGTTLNEGTLAFANGALGTAGTVAFAGNACLQWLTGNTQDLSGRLQIGDHTATLDTFGNDVTFASGVSGASLTKVGAGTLALTANNTYSGSIHVSAGTLLVTGSNGITQTDSITVNSSIPGATLMVSGRAINSDDQTTVNITTESLTVGDSGSGTLSLIDHGFAVVNNKAYIGHDTGSNGLITVNHASWWTYDDLSVGHAGTGTLNINNGSIVHNTAKVYIGHDSGSNGLATVDGASWVADNNLRVGRAGTGTLRITGGGSIETNSSVTIGEDDGAVGTLTLDNSTMTCNQTLIVGMLDDFNVGYSGTGTLNLTDHSTVKVETMGYVGFQGGSQGTVNVGHGSQLEFTTMLNILNVGYGGTGILNITDGGEVKAVSCYIGGNTGQGFVTVDGKGSTLNCTAGLFQQIGSMINIIGGSTLDVIHGGKVQSERAAIGNATVTVTDEDSSWTCSGAFDITNDGKVIVTKGGSVTAQSGSIGGDATLTISEDGSVKVDDGSLFSSTSLVLGSSLPGRGTLNIGAGGAAGTLNVGSVDSALLGSGTINFNHNESSHTFDPLIQGDITINQIGSGATVLGGENSFTGNTHIDAGALHLADQYAVYNSTVHLSGGRLIFESSVSGLAFTLGGLAASSAGAGYDLLLQNNEGASVALSVGYNGDDSTYAGVLSGSGRLIKVGAGTLTLAGGNTYTGITAVSSGTLALAHSLALKNSTLSMSGGNFEFDHTVSGHAFTLGGLVTGADCNIILHDNAGNPVALSIGNDHSGTGTEYTGILSGAGSLDKIGSSTLTLAGANTYTGRTTVSAGSLLLKNSLALQESTVHLSGGALHFDSSVSGHAFTLGGLASSYGGTGYTIALQDQASTPHAVALSVGNNDANTLYAGALTGSGSLTKEGSGTFTLTGQSSYQGATLITQGAVIVQGGGSISKTSHITVDSAGSATTASLTVDGLLPSSIVSLGDMTVGDAGRGTLTLRNWGLVSVGGRNGTGTLTLAKNAGSFGTLNIDSGEAAGTLHAAQVSGGAGTAIVNLNQTDDSYVFLPQLTGSVALNQNGSGSTVLVQSNTHAGPTTVTAGTLQVANGNALQNSTLILNGGHLILDNAVSGHAFTLGGLTGEKGNHVVLQDNAATPHAVAFSVGNNNTDTEYSGDLSGTGSLTKMGSGMLALNGTNSYEGFTTVTAGTLQVNGSNTGMGELNVAAGATLGGTGSIAGAVNVTGVLSPGASIGVLTSGDLTLANQSTYQYDVNSSVSPTVGADLHVVNGALSLGGLVTLSLTDLGTGTFNAGTVFSLLNYTTGLWNSGLFTYQFTALTDNSFFSFLDKIWTIDYDATTKGTNVAGTESGNYVNITLTDAYTHWIKSTDFAIPADKQGATDDPDGDGASNLVEFAFGGKPSDPTLKGLIFGIQADSSGAGGAKQMILTVAVRNGVTFSNSGNPVVADATVDGLNYTIQGSADLTDWTAPVTPLQFDPGMSAAPEGYHYVSFGLNGSDGLPTQGFLRAMVERP